MLYVYITHAKMKMFEKNPNRLILKNFIVNTDKA